MACKKIVLENYMAPWNETQLLGFHCLWKSLQAIAGLKEEDNSAAFPEPSTLNLDACIIT
jgi:hypothetical protein